MPDFSLRKLALPIEEISHENGPLRVAPRLRADALAVVRHSSAERYEPTLEGAVEDLEPLGLR